MDNKSIIFLVDVILKKNVYICLEDEPTVTIVRSFPDAKLLINLYIVPLHQDRGCLISKRK